MLKEIGIGLAGMLAQAGVNRMLRALKLAMLFRRGIRGERRPDISTIAEGELRRAIGNENQLTEPMQQFLIALSESGLMANLCDAAALYPFESDGSVRVHEGQMGAFKALYAEYVGRNTGDAEDWYRRILGALTTAFHDAEAGPFQSHRQITAQRELMANLRSVDRKLLGLFVGTGTKPATFGAAVQVPPDELDAFVHEIAGRLASRYENVTVYGPEMRRRPVELDHIFVPCGLVPPPVKLGEYLVPLHGKTKSKTAGELLPLVHYDEFAADFWVTTPRSSAPDNGRVNVVERTTLTPEELSATFTRAVVLGNPGGGKSTLVQRIALDLCRGLSAGAGRLPVVVTIRDYEQAIEKRPQLPLETFIADALAQAAGCEISSLILKNLLAFGRAVLIFDGLDEIMDIGRRARFVEDINVVTAAYPLCSTLVTSRKVGYDQAPLPPVFERFILDELSPGQSEEYFRRLSVVVVEMPEEEAGAATKDFLAKTAHASDLIGNPLMLGLMTWLYHERRGELPTTRARLYRACAELLFEQWDKLRNLNFPYLPEAFEVSRLLPELAWEIYPDQSLTASVERTWLQERIEQHLKTEYDIDRETRARRDAGHVVDFVTGRAWIMTDAGLNAYRFTHRTFLEYFFSRALNDRSETLEELFDQITPHIVDGTWAVPASLALDDRVSSRTPVAKQVAEKLCSIAGNVDPAARPTLLQFLRDALDYLSGAPEADVRRVVEAALDLVPLPSTVEALQLTSNRKRSIIVETLSRFVAEKLNMRGSTAGQFADWFMLLSRSAAEIDERTKIVFATLPPTYADQDVGMAKIRLDILGTHAEVAARHGAVVWDSSIRIYSRMNTVISDCVAALEQLRSVAFEGADLENQPMARFAVALAQSILDKPELRLAPAREFSTDKLPDDFPASRLVTETTHDIALAAMVCLTLLRDATIPILRERIFEQHFANAWAAGGVQRFGSLLGDPPRRFIVSRLQDFEVAQK